MMNEIVPIDEDGHVDLAKFQTTAKILENFFQFSSCSPSLEEIPQLISLLKALPSLTISAELQRISIA